VFDASERIDTSIIEKEKKEDSNATDKIGVNKQAQEKNGSYVRRQEVH
jgi:hypothetical protein